MPAVETEVSGPKVFVETLVAGQAITSTFLAKRVQIRQKKCGESYLSLTLGDRTGEIGAVMWEKPGEDCQPLRDGDVVKVQGLVGTYNGDRQFTIQRLRKAQAAEVCDADYRPVSTKDPREALVEIETVAVNLEDRWLKALLHAILNDPAIRPCLLEAPGAMVRHHAVLGGLLEHTVSVLALCEFMAGHYPEVNRDLLATAAILHDLGKLAELTWQRAIDYTDAGRLVGHIALGLSTIESHLRAIPDFPDPLRLQLLHCIVAHHGQLQFGSPREPMSVEALCLHMADYLDASRQEFREATGHGEDPQHPGWTPYSKALGRAVFVGGARRI